MKKKYKIISEDKVKALISAMFWGLDPLITHAYSKGMKTSKNKTFYISWLKELVSLILVGLFFWKSIKLSNISRMNKLKLSLAGIFGGAISLSLYVSSMALIGFGLSDLLISLYPIIVLLLSRIIFKEKININSFVAILLIVLGAILVGYSTSGDSNANLGIILALLGSVSFGVEALIIKSIDQPKINIGSMLFIKYLASTVALFILILISSAIPNFLSFWELGNVLFKFELFFVILAGMNALASYFFYYKAISITKSPSIIVAINSSYILFAMIISWSMGDSVANAYNVSGTILIFLGLILTSIKFKKSKSKIAIE